mmetsp:Transcript_14819/g.13301  ORF Transcript_14819/g.13301 Transcript_14819/m.13301 type:complete len:168 (-) Transcript_14819:142-645(-)
MPRRGGFGGFGGGRRRRASPKPKPKQQRRRQSTQQSRRRPAPPPQKRAPQTQQQQSSQQGSPGIGGGGLGSALATGAAIGVGSSLAHAAVGGIMNAGGDNEEGVMYDEGGYDNQYNDNYGSDLNEHPCIKYWNNFQRCIDQNSSDIARCQQFYSLFEKCQGNPDGYM